MLSVMNEQMFHQGSENSFLHQWVQGKREFYQPQKELTHCKIDAIFCLLFYGAAKWETLNTVAKAAKISAGTLRVWRTKSRFKDQYYKVVWNCANAFVGELVIACKPRTGSQENNWMRVAPLLLSFGAMGTALQHAILWRIVINVLPLCNKWPPFIDRCDMIDDLWDIADPPPPPMKPIETGVVTPGLLHKFVWQALDHLHDSRASSLQQRQRHFAIKTFLGLKLIHAASGAARSPQTATEAVGVPFQADRADVEALEETFNDLYAKPLKMKRSQRKPK